LVISGSGMLDYYDPIFKDDKLNLRACQLIGARIENTTLPMRWQPASRAMQNFPLSVASPVGVIKLRGFRTKIPVTADLFKG
jgi:hypothetical protein